MPAKQDDIQELVEHPRESLSIELKDWLDLDSPEGISKLVLACLALRNHGGGFLLIGFRDGTLEPNLENAPSNVQKVFHPDKVQGLVSRFASEQYEVYVHLGEREGKTFPVVEISSGVRTPVATKSGLQDSTGKLLIRENRVYVRTLATNNTPSTAEATWKDWPRIVETCFDNREADIGRFARRHLSGLSGELLQALGRTLAPKKTEPEKVDALEAFMTRVRERFKAELARRSLTPPPHGTWEVVAMVAGDCPRQLSMLEFLNQIASGNPDFSGWPVWLDSRGFRDQDARPYVFEDGWEALIWDIEANSRGHLDFWRIESSGLFYLRRGLADDLSPSMRAPEPGTTLEIVLTTAAVAEAIAVAIEFAKSMGCAPERTSLSFLFSWTGLAGRELSTWEFPERRIRGNWVARQDSVVSRINIPLETPRSALSPHVQAAVAPLARAFGGFEMAGEVIEDLTMRRFARQL